MDFTLSEDQRAIQDVARQFAVAELAPQAGEWDQNSFFPLETLRAAAELGLGGLYVGEPYGTGLGRLDAALVFEELSAGCVATAAYLSIHNMATWMIDRFGNDEQRARFLPDLVSMAQCASYCLTEPGAGSDAASLRTKAVRDGDDYILNGSKAFISGAGTAGIYVVMARTGGAGPKGISCFAIEKDRPGLSFGKQEKKMGWNCQPTAAVIFEDCRVPAANLIGGEGEGFRIAMAGLDGGRLNIAACSLGGARFAFETARDYVKTRQQFGAPLADLQSVQFKLADMATKLDAARLMVQRAAFSLDNNDPDKTQHCAMGKRLATDLCFEVVDDALQLHGGYGYLKEYPIERILRDLRVHRILEGTNEIMRLIVARRILSQ